MVVEDGSGAGVPAAGVAFGSLAAGGGATEVVVVVDVGATVVAVVEVDGSVVVVVEDVEDVEVDPGTVVEEVDDVVVGVWAPAGRVAATPDNSVTAISATSARGKKPVDTHSPLGPEAIVVTWAVRR
jgi:hypothetical protein